MRKFCNCFGILVTSLQAAKAVKLRVVSNGEGGGGELASLSMIDLEKKAPCAHRIINSGDFSLLLDFKPQEDWDTLEKDCWKDVKFMLDYLKKTIPAARTFDEATISEYNQNLDFATDATKPWTDGMHVIHGRVRPYSFLFVLTAFQLALERGEELISEDTSKSVVNILSQVLKLVLGPAELFIQESQYTLGIFDWAYEGGKTGVPGFITALITGYAEISRFGDSPKLSYLFRSIHSAYSREKITNRDEKIKVFVCMVRRTKLSAHDQFGRIFVWLYRELNGNKVLDDAALPSSLHDCNADVSLDEVALEFDE